MDKLNFLRTNKLKSVLVTFCYLFLALSIMSCGGGGGGGGGISSPSLPVGTFSISGKVTSEGSGLASVAIALSGATSATTTTDGNGYYQFLNLYPGTYNISPNKAGYVFTPSTKVVTIASSNISGQDFTATAIRWAKTFGGTNRDVVHVVQQTSDGGFIIAGETSSFGTVNTDFWVMKLNANGEILWSKTYGGNGLDIARSIQQTSYGGYILAGETSSFSSDTDFWILKLDASGNIQWQRRYGGTGIDKAYSVQITSDNGYIVTGETSSFGAQGADAWVIKLNSSGAIIWGKRYGGNKDDIAHLIQALSDGYILVGETNSFSSDEYPDLWVVKLDINGNISWQKTYGGTNEDVGYFIQKTKDNGFIVCGKTKLSGTIFYDAWLLKINSTGEIVWQKRYGGPNEEIAYSIQQTADGGYIFTGITTSFGNVLGDGWLLKIKSDGEIEWQKTFEGDYSNSIRSVQQIESGGYIVAGETSSYGAGDADAWILKIDKNGLVGSGCSFITASSGICSATSISPLVSTAVSSSTSAFNYGTSITPQNSSVETRIQ